MKIEVLPGHVFHLHNQKISYLCGLLPNHQLAHLYYGEPLTDLTAKDLDYLLAQDNKSAGTIKYSKDYSNLTLADHAQEYPVYGTSDFKTGAIELEQDEEPWYPDFAFTDYQIEHTKKRELAHPATYSQAGESQTLNLFFEDQAHRLRLTLSFTIFEHFGVIARSQKLTNLGQESVMVRKMMSGILNLPTADYQFAHLSGAWLKERQVKWQPLSQGTMSVGSLKGASGHQHNPFVALAQNQTQLDHGAVYAANLVYSGNFLSEVEVDEWDKTRLMIGINPDYFSWQLDPQASFETPEALLYFSDQGLNGLMTQTGAFTEKHIVDRAWQKRPRPIVFNNWEATYFDFDQERLLALAQQGKQLGMECFVLDDGWFGHRDDDRSSLGDWQVDRRKFPDGLGTFADKIHDLGLQFGLWFEPEMVSPGSHLYQQHPDWVVRHPYPRIAIGRGQYVLDFANPQVVDDVYQQMKSIIEQTQLDYIKWDMNRNITEAYSPYLKTIKRPQTEFFHRYILGVYDLYTRLLTDFPKLLIEGCAGGGGRYDLGILFYSPQIWPSDDSDAVERLKIQTGTLLGYPLSSFSNHVSASPNDQTGRVTSIKMRQDVCLFGPLGYELDLNALSKNDQAAIRAHIAFYKAHRQLLTHGQFFQLFPVQPNQNEVAWGVANADHTEFFIGFYRVLTRPNSAAVSHFLITQVKADQQYMINDEGPVSGRVLQQFGLREPYQFNGANHGQAQVKGDFQSYIFHLQAVKSI